MEFVDQSLVCDYNGETIIIANAQSQLLIADIDLAKAEKTRLQKSYSGLRRPELYA